MKILRYLLIFAFIPACSSESNEPMPGAGGPIEGQSQSATSDATAQPFQMTIVDVFTISRGGVVATGKISSGSVSIGDNVCLTGPGGGRRELSVTGIEIFRKIVESAKAGETSGLQISGIDKSDVSRGDTLSSHCD